MADDTGCTCLKHYIGQIQAEPCQKIMSDNKVPVPAYSEKREIECQTELEEDCFIEEHPINEEVVETQIRDATEISDTVPLSKDFQITIRNDHISKKDFAIASKKLLRQTKVITPSKFAEEPIDESKWEFLSKSYGSKKPERNSKKKPIMKKPKQNIVDFLGLDEKVMHLTDGPVSITYPCHTSIPVYYSNDTQPHYITVLNPEDENSQLLQCTDIQIPLLGNGIQQDSDLLLNETQTTCLGPSVPQTIVTHLPQSVSQATVTNWTNSVPMATITNLSMSNDFSNDNNLIQYIPQSSVTILPQSVSHTSATSLTQSATLSADINSTHFVPRTPDTSHEMSIAPECTKSYVIKESTLISQKVLPNLPDISEKPPTNTELDDAQSFQTEHFRNDRENEQDNVVTHDASVGNIIQNNPEMKNDQQQHQQAEPELNAMAASLDIVESSEHTQSKIRSIDIQKLIDALQNDGRDLQMLANFINNEQGEIHIDGSPLKFIVIESSSEVAIDANDIDNAVNISTCNIKDNVRESVSKISNEKSAETAQNNNTVEKNSEISETFGDLLKILKINENELKEKLKKWKIKDPEQLNANDCHEFLKEINKSLRQKENEGTKMTEKRRKYKCDMCTLSFTKSCNLSAHKRIHAKDKRFVCTICNQRFYVGTKLRAHMRKHTNSRPFECKICYKSFRETSVLIKHMNTHDGEKAFQCEICYKGFYCQSKLDLHLKSHSSEKPYKCEHCGRRFAVIYYYRRHVKRHAKEKEFKCHVCKKGFHLKESYKFHLLTHDDSLKKRCEKCHKLFIRKSQLKSHVCTGIPVEENKSKIQCDECDKSFSNKLQLTIHLKEHKGEITHKCEICGKLFLHDYLLKRHLVVHTDKKPYKCKICNAAFGWITSIRQHILKKHKNSVLDDKEISPDIIENQSKEQTEKFAAEPEDGEKMICCQICRKKMSKPAFSSHMEHHFKFPFLCCACLAMFSNDNLLKTHLETHVVKDKHDKENGFILMCQICQRSLKSSEEIYIHTISHKEKNFSCKFCYENFINAELLQNHLATHKAESDLIKCDICKAAIQKSDSESHKLVHIRYPFTCEICFMNFETEYFLQNHQEIHKGDKPHRCNLCGEKFATLQEVTKHREIHKDEQEKPNKCETCGKRFRQASDLKNHQRLHTGEKPFGCDLCKETFSRRDYVRKHKIKVHQRGEVFKCEQCSKEFWIQSELKRHIATSHNQIKPYDCNFCERSFSQRYELNKHLENLHKGKPFKCLNCPETFSERKHLNRHIKKMHPSRRHSETISKFIKKDGADSSEEDMDVTISSFKNGSLENSDGKLTEEPSKDYENSTK